MRLFRRDSGLRAGDQRELLVDRGRVSCPRMGQADIEQCFVCGWMADARLGGSQPTLRCVAYAGPVYGDRTAAFALRP